MLVVLSLLLYVIAINLLNFMIVVYLICGTCERVMLLYNHYQQVDKTGIDLL